MEDVSKVCVQNPSLFLRDGRHRTKDEIGDNDDKLIMEQLVKKGVQSGGEIGHADSVIMVS